MKFVELELEGQTVCSCPFCGTTLLEKVYEGDPVDEDGEESEDFYFNETPCEHTVFMEVSKGDGLYNCDDQLSELARHVDDWYELFQEGLRDIPEVYWFDRTDSGIACGPYSITWNCLTAKDAKSIKRLLIALCEKEIV